MRFQNDNNCLGLAELDTNGPAPWPSRVVAGVTNFTARIGPAGGARGYTPITGKSRINSRYNLTLVGIPNPSPGMQVAEKDFPWENSQLVCINGYQ